MQIELKPVEEQVVVLMGASSGIGRDAAKLFARRGAKVVVAARNGAGLQSLVEEIAENGGEATYVVADVTDFEQVERVASHAVHTFGRIDTWVQLAAVSVYATFEETTPEEFRQVLDVNLMGQVHGAKAALPYLRREGRGALIHISSIEGVRTLPYQAAYGASKHGVIGFIEALRLELQHEGVPISVTNIMPATINTPFFNKARTKLGVMPKGLPPIYSPRVVAQTIVYAAENPVADIFAGDAARMVAAMQKFSPRLMDKYLLSSGFSGQHTNRPKSEYAPDNLYAPVQGYERVRGDFSKQTMPVSITNEMQTNSMLRAGLAGVLVGAAAAAAAKALRRNTGEYRY
jgi:NAD(P)-dependent dehydrogenase (short-subunit alcohol dehydrogenase family)